MPICDGSACSREVPWRITQTALQMQNGNVAFSLDTVHRQMLAVLTAAKCWNIIPPKSPVVFKNLCKACWDKQAASWGDVATYTLARAKTTAQGIFMQVQRDDFKVANVFSKEAILSCVIHELMHFWSKGSVGIQTYNRVANVDWDEMVADVMGYRVYTNVYRGQGDFAQYLTPYNTYCVSFARMKAQFQNVFGRLWREANDCNRLPGPVRDFITSSKGRAVQLAAVKVPAADLLVKVLQEYFFTWFFQGPHAYIADGVSAVSIDNFLRSDNLGNMFSVTNVYQSYDGTNTAHGI